MEHLMASFPYCGGGFLLADEDEAICHFIPSLNTVDGSPSTYFQYDVDAFMEAQQTAATHHCRIVGFYSAKINDALHKVNISSPQLQENYCYLIFEFASSEECTLYAYYLKGQAFEGIDIEVVEPIYLGVWRFFSCNFS